jgi:hypothetical protein
MHFECTICSSDKSSSPAAGLSSRKRNIFHNNVKLNNPNVLHIETLRHTLRTLMPKVLPPWAWWLRSSVTVAIGLRPAFSASVNGMTFRASAKARKQYCSIPVSVCEYSSNRTDNSISGAPPPAINALNEMQQVGLHTLKTETTMSFTIVAKTTTKIDLIISLYPAD